MNSQKNKYNVVFEGKFRLEVTQSEVRQRLLTLYKGNQETVNRFFSGKSLIVKKHADFQTAQKYRSALEKAGALCRIVQVQSAVSELPGDKIALPQTPSAPRTIPPEEKKQVSTEARAIKKDASQPFPKIAAKPADRPLLSGTKFQNALAAVLITLLVVSVGVRIWALSKADGIYVPDQVASNGKDVCIHFNGTLYFLSPDGTLHKRVNLSDLGIDSEPADLELLEDGSLLVGDLDKGEILRCDTKSLSCRRVGPVGDYAIVENFKFLADEERNLLFIADTNNHSLMVQDMEGNSIREVEHESTIRYPNDMVLDKSGRLWLSNTRYSSVVSFAVEDENIVETKNTIKLLPRIQGVEDLEDALKKDSPDKAGDLKILMEKMRNISKERAKLGDDLVQTRPLALLWDVESNLWVIASDGFITTAGVRVFSPEGEQIMRIPLGEKAIPLDIAQSGGDILIVDSGLFKVFSVNTATDTVTEFGDENFQTEISRTRSELRRYEGIKRWAGRGIWILALGTIILVMVIIIGSYKTRPSTTTYNRRPQTLPGQRMQPAGVMKSYQLAFNGSAGEYFRIWIVNTFLTIVTIGVYAAWAKVRTRRYFYRNTILDGHAFDYTADPMALFKGYAIVGGGMLIYYLSKAFIHTYSLIVFGLFALVIPLLIYKSLRFFSRNSVYRNIRLRFLGSLGDSYRTYLFYPILIPFTLGLIVPYWAFLRKKYFFHNLAFGTTNNSFRGNHGPFYKVYILTGLAVTGFVFIFFMISSFLMAGMAIISSAETGAVGASVIFMVILTYATILIVSTFLQQFLYAWELNYCLGNSELGQIRFESSLNGGRLFWIRISNIFAIIFSIGLLIPWAKVRRMRYIVDNITLITDHDLNDFAAAAEPDESAYGDAATEFFDFEIGL